MITRKDLHMRNYVLCVDRSGSMSAPKKSNSSQTRWDAIKESTLALTRVCEKLDSDGIDVYFFNTDFKKFTNVTADKVNEMFEKISPNGGTDFVPVLREVFQEYKKGDKPATILVVTDGSPSEVNGKKELADLIISATKKMEDDSELGISFIQIGEDKDARDFLKSLDDDLTSQGAKFDIVDTVTMDELANREIEDVLLSAVND